MEHVPIKKSTDYIVGVLNSGLGNKLFLLLQYYYIYKIIKKNNSDVKLYILNSRSHHEKEEKIDIFNLFEILHDIEKMNWYEFDKIKDRFKESITKFPESFSLSTIKSYKLPLYINYILPDTYMPFTQKIIDSFNFIVRNPSIVHSKIPDIGVHVRYGDKLQINKSKPNSYLLAPPIWYIRAINSVRKPGESVCFYTDSPKIVKEFILPFIEEPVSISNSNPEETLKELCVVKKMILTDSTLPQSALVLRKTPCDVIIPKYEFKITYPNILNVKSSSIKVHSLPMVSISSYTIDELIKYL
jgi:hypothetical protein